MDVKGGCQISFKESTAKWWHRVGNNRCQIEIYSERDGFQNCNQPSQHIHHIEPEGTILARGEDSERAVGMPLCSRHHVRNTGDEEFSDN